MRLLNTNAIIFSFITLLTFESSAQKETSLFINEFCASNATLLPGELYEFDDWVEIYNGGKEAVDMGGMFFSDKRNKPQKWKVPASSHESTTIQPGDHLLFWFDGNTYLGELHADLKLNGVGDSLFLFDKDGLTLFDYIGFGRQYIDFSYGRFHDGGKQWTFFITPTPASANHAEKIISVSAEMPVFSISAGFYKEDVSIEITSPDKSPVYYTTDGSLPTASSNLYQSKIKIDSTTIIRARAITNEKLPSPVATQTYFINEKITVPVVSLVANPLHLWDSNVGIYTNMHISVNWPVHVEYFDEKGAEAFSLDANFRLFGNITRKYAKKSFSVETKDKYGIEKIHYKFFEDRAYEDFDGFLLRADPAVNKYDHPKLAGERVKNEITFQVIKEMGSNVGTQAYKPVVLFINGEYWGLYTLLERKNKMWIRNNYGCKDFDYLNGYDVEVIEGDDAAYLNFLDFLNELDMGSDEAFDSIEKRMVVESFVDFWICQIYNSSNDINYNVRYWKPRTPDGRWRWFNFDNDSWAGVEDSTFEKWSKNKQAKNIRLLGRLLENKEFRNYFINRFADCLNTVYIPQNMHRLVDDITAVIEAEKVRDRERWEAKMPYVPLNSQVNWLKDFADRRPFIIRDQMLGRFNLPGIAELTLDVNSAEMGTIHINTIDIASFPWKGIYFHQVPVSITAIPNKGYEFKGWSDKKYSRSPTAMISFTAPMKLTAIFQPSRK